MRCLLYTYAHTNEGQDANFRILAFFILWILAQMNVYTNKVLDLGRSCLDDQDTGYLNTYTIEVYTLKQSKNNKQNSSIIEWYNQD